MLWLTKPWKSTASFSRGDLGELIPDRAELPKPADFMRSCEDHYSEIMANL
jgi:hypothetical protein